MNKLQLIGGKFEGSLETIASIPVGMFLSITIARDNEGKENHTLRPRKETYLVRHPGIAEAVPGGSW